MVSSPVGKTLLFDEKTRISAENMLEVLMNCFDGAWFWENHQDLEKFMMSPRMKKRLGYGDNANIGETRHWWFDNFHPDDVPKFLEVRESYLLNKETVHCEVAMRIRHRDESYIPFSVQLYIIKDEYGKLEFGGGVFLDISKFDAPNAGKTTVNKDINQSLRTSISSIVGMIELLRSSQMDDRQNHYLDNIQESANSILGAIEKDSPSNSKETVVLEKKSELAPQGHRQLNILLVEDNKINQEVLVGLINSIGDKIEVANHGLEALEMFDKKEYDLILMDINMPIMDGITATRKIRETAKGRDIPIIAVTANTIISDKNNCISHGMNDVVTKPVTKIVLENVLCPYRSSDNLSTNKIKEEVLTVEAPVVEASAQGYLMLQIEAIDGLIEDLGFETIDRLFSIYKRDAMQMVEQLSTKDVKERHDIAHTLAGMSENLGIFGMGKVARTLMDLRENQSEAGDKLVQQIQESFTMTLSEIDRFLKERS